MMKLDPFHRYQVADLLANASNRCFGMLFAWLMLNKLALEQELGYWVAAAWVMQVLVLLFLSYRPLHYQPVVR